MIKQGNRQPVAEAVKINFKKTERQALLNSVKICTKSSECVEHTKDVKKLKERIEELEFIKDLQQDIIVDFQKVTGQELSKKYLPEALANEIARKKKKLTK